jgi:DNA polymerase I-like protein with 3'-5' exonuclease and polymerase domains
VASRRVGRAGPLTWQATALAKMQEDWDAGTRTDATFLVSVHDEIVLEAPESSAEDVARWLHGKMQAAFEEVLGL